MRSISFTKNKRIFEATSYLPEGVNLQACCPKTARGRFIFSETAMAHHIIYGLVREKAMTYDGSSVMTILVIFIY